jgi:hypothetical protein
MNGEKFLAAHLKTKSCISPPAKNGFAGGNLVARVHPDPGHGRCRHGSRHQQTTSDFIAVAFPSDPFTSC